MHLLNIHTKQADKIPHQNAVTSTHILHTKCTAISVTLCPSPSTILQLQSFPESIHPPPSTSSTQPHPRHNITLALSQTPSNSLRSAIPQRAAPSHNPLPLKRPSISRRNTKPPPSQCRQPSSPPTMLSSPRSSLSWTSAPCAGSSSAAKVVSARPPPPAP